MSEGRGGEGKGGEGRGGEGRGGERRGGEGRGGRCVVRCHKHVDCGVCSHGTGQCRLTNNSQLLSTPHTHTERQSH